MEIRCTHCQHVGPAASVEPGPQGVMLICEHCGEGNLLEIGSGAVAAATPVTQEVEPGSIEETPVVSMTPPRPTQAALPDVGAEPLLTPQALERLIPEYGDGLRCRKCAHLVRPDDRHCARCGLDIEDSFRYPEGQAPWELAPRGSEAAFDRALLLWEVAEQDWSVENATKFAHFVRDEGFHEMGIRKLRFFLIEHPDDQVALTHLKDLAMRMQSRLIIARAQAEVSAQQFTSGVKRTRKILIWSVVAGWSIIFILFLGRFMDNCG